MSQPIIQVEGLGKRFIIGHQKQERYTAFRDVIANSVKGAFRRTRELMSGNYMTEGDTEEEFWALKEINFSVNQGDRVGIIGRNGAGKSTLLKILSRITEPSRGRIVIRGRIASLLEVGTGFHPELTGRENIFLNGAILGMSRAEIRKKFDEIVAFAEVERFLDTPVKRYSSGMYVRLAFSVAAHLEPEILIVDEVLAVGDAQFQKKCLGKIEDVSKEGRTVLFVSHNMGTVKALCNIAILLQSGTLVAHGQVMDIVKEYTSYAALQNLNTTYKHLNGTKELLIEKIEINKGLNVISIYSPISIDIHFKIEHVINKYHFFVLIHNTEGDVVWSMFQKDSNNPFFTGRRNKINVKFKNILTPGNYFVSAGIFDSNNQFVDWVDKAETIEVDNSFEDGLAFDYRYGMVTTNSEWNGE
jgi:lipopolysaccharide transport system ATP-binding protein